GNSEDHRPARERAMNEVIREFLIETHENLSQLDLDLVTLEKEPTERETLGRVFRTLHTVKGTAGFLGLQKLQAVAHAAENLLSWLREGKLVFNAEIASVLLTVVDAVRQMLAAVEKDETDGEGDFSALIQNLGRLRAARGTLATPVSLAPAEQSLVGQASSLPPPGRLEAYPTEGGASRENTPPPPNRTASLLAPESMVAEVAESRVSAVSDSSIRVDVGLLDKLMTLVGE